MTRTNKEGKAREKEVLIMKKIEEKVIQNVLEVRKRSQEAKSRRGWSLRNKNVPIKEVRWKIR